MTIQRIFMKFSQRVHTSLKTYNIEKNKVKIQCNMGWTPPSAYKHKTVHCFMLKSLRHSNQISHPLIPFE